MDSVTLEETMETDIIVACIALGTALVVAGITWKQGKAIEETKSKLHRFDFVHRLQFEKEFQIYGELWSDLLSLNEMLAKYLSDSSTLNTTKDIFKLNELTQEMFSNATKFHLKFARNKPFFSEQIYIQVQALDCEIFNLPTTIYQDRGLDPLKYAEEMARRTKRMGEIVETISTLIRKRITLPSDATISSS